MRDLTRLIIVGVLVFLVVGFAMIYSRDSGFRYGLSAFLTNSWGALGRSFRDVAGIEDSESEQVRTEIRIPRPDHPNWVGLAGFPDQTEVRFPIPAASGYLHGELDLMFDVQLAQGGDGLLSVWVNGSRRSEIVLNTGHNVYDVSVPLDGADLLADHVLLVMSARGTTNSGQICPTDAANSGSAVALLPESALVLHTMRAADDPETALIAMPDPLRIRLGSDPETQTVAIWTAQRMERAGVRARLLEEADGLRWIRVVTAGDQAVAIAENGDVVLAGRAGIGQAIAFHRADALAPAALTQWPVSVANLTPETIARSFRGSKRWAIPYKIADMPGGLTPTSFDLALRTSILAEDFEWVVRVSLNGNLLHTERFPGTNPDIRLNVPLPVDSQGLGNSLVVELIDTSPNESICRAGPDAQAQLLPESGLRIGGMQPREGWGRLVRQLATSPFVAPGNHGVLDVNQATRAVAMLGQFLPAEANVSVAPEGPAMTITLVDKAGLVDVLSTAADESDPPSRDVWIIMDTGTSVQSPLSLLEPGDPDHAALLGRMHSTDSAFIVQRTRNP